ncbi:MAG TPA: Flp pilus assembly protein CpaB [Planctomycetaceae bacterium]|jgi:pilus assembly protein CpaB|nr:Flp pilus assembly protein CpaB [Planctomycetaceae bacterium]
MKMKSLVLLAMAIGCGLVAMLGVQQVLSGDKKPPAETGKVLVAITNIMPGQPLDDSNVAFKAWDKNDIPQGAVTTHEEYQERSLRVSATPNEPIMIAKLNEKGVFGGSSEIPKGMRVATVPVTVTETHSGLILPGDRVDVVVTYTVPHNIPGQMNSQFGEIKKAKTILQYLEVFATDNIRQSAVPNGEQKELSAKNISLLVTPDQYVLLMLAKSKGNISLAVRNRGDDTEAKASEVDETAFEHLKVTRGPNKKDGDGDEGKVAVRDSLGQEQIKVAQAPPKPEVKPEPVKEKEKPTWLLKVFEGDKLREEQVELPDEPDTSAKGGAKAGSGWMEFFQRALKHNKAS